MYDLPKLNQKEINTSNRSITNGEMETTGGGNLPRVMRWLSGWRCQDPHKRTKSQLPKSKSKQINCWVLQEFQKQTPKFPKLRTEKYQIIFIKLVLILIPVPEKKTFKNKTIKQSFWWTYVMISVFPIIVMLAIGLSYSVYYVELYSQCLQEEWPIWILSY